MAGKSTVIFKASEIHVKTDIRLKTKTMLTFQLILKQFPALWYFIGNDSKLIWHDRFTLHKAKPIV